MSKRRIKESHFSHFFGILIVPFFGCFIHTFPYCSYSLHPLIKVTHNGEQEKSIKRNNDGIIGFSFAFLQFLLFLLIYATMDSLQLEGTSRISKEFKMDLEWELMELNFRWITDWIPFERIKLWRLEGLQGSRFCCLWR